MDSTWVDYGGSNCYPSFNACWNFHPFVGYLRDNDPATASSRLQEIRNAPPSKLPGLTYQTLETIDLIERQIYIGECLRSVTRENWQEVISSFDKIADSTGRDPNLDWKLALFHSGQVAGEEAMNQYAAQGLASL